MLARPDVQLVREVDGGLSPADVKFIHGRQIGGHEAVGVLPRGGQRAKDRAL